MEIAPADCYPPSMADDGCVNQPRRGVMQRLGPIVVLGFLAVGNLAASPRAVADSPAGPATTSGAAGEIRLAAWPAWLGGSDDRPLFNRGPAPNVVPATPHPAVARIIVPEEGATAYGSGTLIDVREQFGLVITNWHVVRDSQGTVEVVFPSGFRSHARPLKVDSDWDLAALVIWRPPIEPVRVTTTPPQPGDLLTIHGYGQGQYRIATGRCTAYYSPKLDFPREMVELDVEARQGDSGGPIFNQRGELAGVLFGAGQGTTIGSFAPRVGSFLATLAPDIGTPRTETQLAVADRPAPAVHPVEKQVHQTASLTAESPATAGNWPSSAWSPPDEPRSAADQTGPELSAAGNELWFDHLKSAMAIVGFVAVSLQLVRLVK